MFWLLLISAPLLLLLLALCLPITATLAVSSDQDLLVEARVQWVFWQIKHLHFAPFGSVDQPDQAPSRVQPSQPWPKTKSKVKTSEQTSSGGRETSGEPKSKAKKRDRLHISWTTTRPLLHKYLPRCWRALHLRCLHGQFWLAVNDPACYGWIFALMGATRLPQKPISLQVELADQVAFQADCKWRLRLYPIQWLGLALSIGWEPPIRAIWWSKLRKKGENKRARPQSVYRPAGKPYFQQDSHRRSYHSG